MTAPAVVDTNVVVAGLISRPGESPVCQIVDGMLVGTFPFLLSTDLVDEYRRVLLRPALQKLHGLSDEQIDVIMTEMAANALVREPRPNADLEAPDRGDDHLWHLLATTPGATLVTGDKALIAAPPEFAVVVSPREFADSLSKAS